jgi:hypothetical protein
MLFCLLRLNGGSLCRVDARLLWSGQDKRGNYRYRNDRRGYEKDLAHGHELGSPFGSGKCLR